MAWCEDGWPGYGWCGDKGGSFALIRTARTIKFSGGDGSSFALNRPVPVFVPVHGGTFDLKALKRILNLSGNNTTLGNFALIALKRVLRLFQGGSFNISSPKRDIAFVAGSTGYFNLVRKYTLGLHEDMGRGTFSLTRNKPIIPFLSSGSLTGYFNLKRKLPSILFTDSPLTNGIFTLQSKTPTLLFHGDDESTGIFNINFPIRTLSFKSKIATEDIIVLVLNLDNLAGPTFYSNFDFEDMIQIGSDVYFKDALGQAFRQTGDTDNETAIDAFVELPEMDFGTSGIKTIEGTYLSMNTDGPIRFRTKSDGEYFNDSEVDSTGSLIKTKRVVLSRGLRSRYHGVRIDNINGSDFTLNELELSPIRVSNRKGE